MGDLLLMNPTTGIAGCCARRERPRGRRTAEQHDEFATAVEQRIVIDQQCVGPLMPEARKGRIDLVIGARGENFDLPPNGYSCCPHVCDRGLSNSGIVWIDEHGETCGSRQQLVQEPKALGPRFIAEGDVDWARPDVMNVLGDLLRKVPG